MKRLVFILFFLLIGCFSAVSSTEYKNILVTEVVDGDTVRLVNDKLLRYIGIDTPELRIKKNGKFVYMPQPFGKEAKALNQKLVEGKHVRVEFDVQKLDKYNRLLGYCFVNDLFVNQEMLNQGVAVLYTYPPNVRYTDDFFQAQKTAQENKQGLWGSYEEISPEQAKDYVNQVRTVVGKVLSTYQSKKCVYLNFGRDYKTDFTVVIFRRDLKYFKDAGIDPVEFYKGKTVKVFGRIREYNGPEIISAVPEEISVVK